MRNITIKNFRCYENKTMEFRPGINLLIGDNSVGKTSLLRACNLVMNAFFSGYSDENTKWNSAEDDDFKTSEMYDQPINISFFTGDWDFRPIKTPNGLLKEPETTEEFRIEKKSKKNSRNLVTGLKPLRDYAELLQANSHSKENGKIVQANPLPLYACFTTEDIHSVRKMDKSRFKNQRHKPSFGYYECFDSRGLFECWIKRLLVLKEAKTGEVEINNVRNAIVDCLGDNGCGIIREMHVLPNDGKVHFTLSDGRLVRADLLSDGYRRLVSIVMDLAIRSALLNKFIYGDEAYKKTHGTVIIDEIDEHLHPELQVRILKALHEAFPKIQFIVSTHAPLVMSSVENSPENVVYKLEYDKEAQEYYHTKLDTYGLDVNSILEYSMDTLVRPDAVGKLIKEARDFLAEYKIEEAKAIVKELGNITSPHQADLVQLRAIITRLEMLKK